MRYFKKYALPSTSPSWKLHVDSKCSINGPDFKTDINRKGSNIETALTSNIHCCSSFWIGPLKEGREVSLKICK